MNSYEWNNRGARHAEREQWKKALACYDRALALDPENYNAHYNKGNALGGMEHWEEALASYDHGLALAPEMPYLWHGKGFALYRLALLKEANADIQAGVGLLKEAHACLERAVGLDPADDDLRRIRDTLMAQLIARGGVEGGPRVSIILRDPS